MNKPNTTPTMRADGGQRHVFLCIPLVALRADIGGAEFTAEHLGRTPLDQFVDVRRRHREQQRHPPGRAVRCLAAAHQPVVAWNRQQQPEREMHQPIILIALRAGEIADRLSKQVLRPRVVRHLRIRVVRADRMQREEDQREDHRRLRHRALAPEHHQQPGADQRHHVLEHPVGAADRRDRHRTPENGERCDRNSKGRHIAPRPSG